MSDSRFGVAARPLEGSRRGVGRWLLEVLEEIRKAGRDSDLTLYFEHEPPPDLDTGKARVRVTGPGPGGGSTAWEQVALRRALREDRPAALLGPDNSLPGIGRTPGVLVLHDLSFEAFPRWYSPREGTRRRVLARLGARRARVILAVSEFTARAIETLYGTPPDRIRVTPNGVSTRFRPAPLAAVEEVRQRWGLDGKVVLSVGSLFTRRCPAELIAAVALLRERHPDVRLVLCGDNRTWPHQDIRGRIAQAGLADRTTWLEAVSEDDIVALYSLARVSVYLSEYEGFGLPPLEALACGTPVLASATSALIENLEGHATLLERHDPPLIAERLADLLEAPLPPRSRPAWLERLSWARVATIVLDSLSAAATP